MNDGRSRGRRRGRGGGRGRQSDRRRDPDRGHRPAADAVRLGLMGPYMAPIPVNASAAMVFSFFVAVVIAPWLMVRFARKTLTAGRRASTTTRAPLAASIAASPRASSPPQERLDLPDRGRPGDPGGLRDVRDQDRDGEAAAIRQQVGAAGGAEHAGGDLAGGHPARPGRRGVVTRTCRKSPRSTPMPGPPRRSISTASCGTTICATSPRWATCRWRWRPRTIATATATPSPWTCASGLAKIALPAGAVIKVVEAPPGPPVMATLLAEIYGPDAADPPRRRRARQGDLPFGALHRRHRRQLRPARPGLRCRLDRDRLEALRVSDHEVYDSIGAALGGQASATPIAAKVAIRWKSPCACRSRPAAGARAWRPCRWPSRRARRRASGLAGRSGRRDPGAGIDPHLSGATAATSTWSLGELAGSYEAPIYGMLAVDKAIKQADWGGSAPPDIRAQRAADQ